MRDSDARKAFNGDGPCCCWKKKEKRKRKKKKKKTYGERESGILWPTGNCVSSVSNSPFTRLNKFLTKMPILPSKSPFEIPKIPLFLAGFCSTSCGFFMDDFIILDIAFSNNNNNVVSYMTATSDVNSVV